MSKVYSIKTIQNIPASMEVVWQFFSNPGNLKMITPAELDFKMISIHHGDHLYAGQIIEYQVKPLLGIPVYWMTEITHVADQQYFIDEQRYGPYAFWHHQHHFRPIDGGIEMTDIVHYKIPLGFMGDFANTWFVHKKLNNIFNFRFNKIQNEFGRLSV